MNTDKSQKTFSFFSICVYLRLSAVPILLLCGCGGKPSAANIELRKENQQLRDRISQLERERQGDQSRIASFETSAGSLPTLPQDRLSKLFTVHGVRIERLTGGARSKPDASHDDILKVYVVPTDEAGDPIKAAGSFTVQAFDLKESGSPLVAESAFSTDEARKSWFGSALLYEYVLTCPLKAPPKHDQLTVNVTFVDELTGRRFEAQKVVQFTLGGK